MTGSQYYRHVLRALDVCSSLGAALLCRSRLGQRAQAVRLKGARLIVSALDRAVDGGRLLEQDLRPAVAG
jgi:hypothetical protein